MTKEESKAENEKKILIVGHSFMGSTVAKKIAERGIKITEIDKEKKEDENYFKPNKIEFDVVDKKYYDPPKSKYHK